MILRGGGGGGLKGPSEELRTSVILYSKSAPVNAPVVYSLNGSVVEVGRHHLGLLYHCDCQDRPGSYAETQQICTSRP